MWTTLLLLILTMPSTVINYQEANIATSGSIVAGSGVFSSLNVNTTPVVLDTDNRLTNNRAPTAHKTSHATGGSDALTPSDIGAAASSHTHSVTDLTATGTPSATTYLRGDGAWAAVSGGGGGSSSASDLTSGTLANARLTTRARASMNLYLWSNFR